MVAAVAEVLRSVHSPVKLRSDLPLGEDMATNTHSSNTVPGHLTTNTMTDTITSHKLAPTKTTDRNTIEINMDLALAREVDRRSPTREEEEGLEEEGQEEEGLEEEGQEEEGQEEEGQEEEGL
ncbi:hypothetical protein E4U42_000820 [Claviceps africana]|uniref:Uncharacterized protein n=1 Tax=Claviceps africana TaxID=83212 RepID=A0A8K0J4Z5_9HYPO|nr:hypothetical protein E4U42_000820 [Claviceps africana]